MSWTIVYELIQLENALLKKLLKPVYLIGYFLQYTLFTSKPDKKHIEVSFVAFNRMLKKQLTICTLNKRGISFGVMVSAIYNWS